MEQNQLSPKKILIVEDDAFMGNLLERKFKQENFEIFRAGTVDEARKILESQPIDLILLDIILPGTDGLTYLKELKINPALKDTPVIITSNLGQQEEIERGIADGAMDYIVKAHATPGEIVQKVEGILGK
jgi:two-component system, OmpR family, phosphate regulon response regulator PhoB